VPDPNAFARMWSDLDPYTKKRIMKMAETKKTTAIDWLHEHCCSLHQRAICEAMVNVWGEHKGVTR
jgi:hypothetical protein